MSKKSKIINTVTKIEYVPVSNITADAAYQRELDERRAGAIAENVDMSRIGVLVVSRRSDGTLVVVDGQHRHAALALAGFGNHLVRCEVHEGLNRREEAALFRKLNNGRKAIGALDDYKAALEARDPMIVEINSIVTSLGLRVDKNQNKGVIAAVLALKSVHMRQRNLEQTLRVLARWDDRPSVFSGELMKGMSVFLAHYANREDAPPIDDAHLNKQLRTMDPDAVLGAIKRRTDRIIKPTEAACTVLSDIYNRRAGAKKRLPPFVRGGQPGLKSAA